MGTPPAVTIVYSPMTRPRNSSGDDPINSPCTTVLSTKKKNPNPASASAVYSNTVDVLITRYITAMHPIDTAIANRRRPSVTNSPAMTRAGDRAGAGGDLQQREARRTLVQEIGHDHREQRGVVHDERDHERDEQQEADLRVAPREPEADRELGQERFVRRPGAGCSPARTPTPRTTARKLAALR